MSDLEQQICHTAGDRERTMSDLEQQICHTAGDRERTMSDLEQQRCTQLVKQKGQCLT